MPARPETLATLRERLDTLTPTHLEVIDESHLHAGHAGAKEGGHYRVQIVSPRFAGCNTVARHRLVFQAVGDLMKGQIHALAIFAKAPDEV